MQIIQSPTQNVFQKKDKIDWKAVAYEAGIGAVSGAIGAVTVGTGSVLVKEGGKIATKQVAKKVAKKAGAAIVEGKSLDVVDYGQAANTAAIAGISGAVGDLISSTVEVMKSAARTVAKTATKEQKIT